MILVELSGGLGNQLFQYAAGLSLACHHGVELKVNAASFDRPDLIVGTQRTFELDNLQTPPQQASNKEIASFLKQSIIKKCFEKFTPFHKRSIYKERSTRFDQIFFEAGKEVYIKGNRQSEKYFKPFEDRIREKIQVKDCIKKKYQTISNEMRETESVAIHIRRGDYLTNIALQVLGLLPLEYYYSAVEYVSQQKNVSTVYVFSDDIPWVKENLNLNLPVKYASEFSPSAIDDFYLMSQCRNQIIANSTFSWWAAWLNDNSSKIVVAPTQWYNSPDFDSTDIIPDEWKKI